MLEVRNLTKRYGPVVALNEVSFSLREGEVIALLGPNGAGKTTFLKILLGLVLPTRGDILWQGKSILNDISFRHLLGYMPQKVQFPPNLTVQELFLFLEDLRGSQKASDWELFEQYELSQYLDRPLRTLSGGTQQRVNAALAFLFSPTIILLDEPSVGMDPIAASFLREKIRKEQQKGKTILFSTHILSEIEELASHIVFLLDGKLCYQGSLEELKKQTEEERVERAVLTLLENQKERTKKS